MGTVNKYYFILYICKEQEYAIRKLFHLNKWQLHSKALYQLSAILEAVQNESATQNNSAILQTSEEHSVHQLPVNKESTENDTVQGEASFQVPVQTDSSSYIPVQNETANQVPVQLDTSHQLETQYKAASLQPDQDDATLRQTSSVFPGSSGTVKQKLAAQVLSRCLKELEKELEEFDGSKNKENTAIKKSVMGGDLVYDSKDMHHQSQGRTILDVVKGRDHAKNLDKSDQTPSVQNTNNFSGSTDNVSGFNVSLQSSQLDPLARASQIAGIPFQQPDGSLCYTPDPVIYNRYDHENRLQEGSHQQQSVFDSVQPEIQTHNSGIEQLLRASAIVPPPDHGKKYPYITTSTSNHDSVIQPIDRIKDLSSTSMHNSCTTSTSVNSINIYTAQSKIFPSPATASSIDINSPAQKQYEANIEKSVSIMDNDYDLDIEKNERNRNKAIQNEHSITNTDFLELKVQGSVVKIPVSSQNSSLDIKQDGSNSPYEKVIHEHTTNTSQKTILDEHEVSSGTSKSVPASRSPTSSPIQSDSNVAISCMTKDIPDTYHTEDEDSLPVDKIANKIEQNKTDARKNQNSAATRQNIERHSLQNSKPKIDNVTTQGKNSCPATAVEFTKLKVKDAKNNKINNTAKEDNLKAKERKKKQQIPKRNAEEDKTKPNVQSKRKSKETGTEEGETLRIVRQSKESASKRNKAHTTRLIETVKKAINEKIKESFANQKKEKETNLFNSNHDRTIGRKNEKKKRKTVEPQQNNSENNTAVKKVKEEIPEKISVFIENLASDEQESTELLPNKELAYNSENEVKVKSSDIDKASFKKRLSRKYRKTKTDLPVIKCQECGNRCNKKGYCKVCKIECPFCDKKFTKCLSAQKLYQTHVKKHINDPRPYPCTACDMKFSSEWFLKRHLENKHINQTDPGPFMCEICSKNFTTKYSLKGHMSAIHGNRKRDVLCDLCGEFFLSQGYLRQHRQYVHQEERNFTCKLCYVSVKTEVLLRRHMARHTEEKNEVCNICGRSFRVRSDLLRHMIRHDNNRRSFKCEQCGKSFFEDQKLKQHIRIHTGVKPYKCNLCTYACAVKGNLTKHLKTHANREGYTGRAYKKKNKTEQIEIETVTDSGPPVQYQIEVITDCRAHQELSHFDKDEEQLPHYEMEKHAQTQYEATKEALPSFETVNQSLSQFEAVKHEFTQFEANKHELNHFEAEKADLPHYDATQNTSEAGAGGQYEVVRLQLDQGGNYYDALRPSHIEAGRPEYLGQQELKDMASENYVNQISLTMIPNTFSNVNKIDFYSM